MFPESREAFRKNGRSQEPVLRAKIQTPLMHKRHLQEGAELPGEENAGFGAIGPGMDQPSENACPA